MAKKKAPVEAPADGAEAIGAAAVANDASSTTDVSAAACPACQCQGKQAYAN